jgi:SWI/SNF-related matrix-associated actin-dependent regulator 1 of chromatin subfamily A
MLIYSDNAWYWNSHMHHNLPRKAGFDWSRRYSTWYTSDPYRALLLIEHADPGARHSLCVLEFNQARSQSKNPIIPVNPPAVGNEPQLYGFQEAGVEVMVDQLRQGWKYLLLADEQGLGKTPQAICVARTLGLQKMLVVCPATLRHNWCEEIKTWWPSQDPQPHLTGKDKVDPDRSVVTSYALIQKLGEYQPDVIVLDECHAVKNPGAQRTRYLLGYKTNPGLIDRAPGLLLSGTPAPNGRPTELYPVLNRCCPHVINRMRYSQFLDRYCYYEFDGIENVVYGARRQAELGARLRGSGFMVRRLKSEVLTQLPPKRFKLVVFPVNAKTARVLKKEKDFSASEIIKHGAPVGSALPEVRREMAIAKVPQAVEYITGMLAAGTDKILVFAHHIQVVEMLADGLKQYKPAVIMGSTPVKKRQDIVREFQTDPNCQVFIGNEAAEEGLTLTAAADVVLVEPEWVPGKNDQRASRAHRIGQTQGVVVHILVVESSLDAKILGSAANKRRDIEKTLNYA